VTELKSRLAESAKSKEVIETGHGLDKPKRFKYLTSCVFCFFCCLDYYLLSLSNFTLEALCPIKVFYMSWAMLQRYCLLARHPTNSITQNTEGWIFKSHLLTFFSI